MVPTLRVGIIMCEVESNGINNGSRRKITIRTVIGKLIIHIVIMHWLTGYQYVPNGDLQYSFGMVFTESEMNTIIDGLSRHI